MIVSFNHRGCQWCRYADLETGKHLWLTLRPQSRMRNVEIAGRREWPLYNVQNSASSLALANNYNNKTNGIEPGPILTAGCVSARHNSKSKIS